MEGDADLIARLYPAETRGHARDMIEKHALCVHPKLDFPVMQRGRTSRESTEPVADGPGGLDQLPYIELRFSHTPRTSLGIVFGKDPTASDVVLPSIPGISRRHLVLTYKNKFDDGLYRLAVRDLGSTQGTIVTYDTKGNHRRSKFDWIIDGFNVADETERLVVQLLDDLRFQLVVVHHDLSSPTYIANVERFRHGAAGAEDLFGGLGIESGPATERNSGALTPVKQPILIPQGWISQGAFGVVSRHWNVSTGEEYACKQPVGEKYNRKDWEREIDIMKQVSHDNIVRLRFWKRAPRPLLYLEYMPFGNLEDAHESNPFSYAECLAIFHQSLSALAYLRGRPEPVVHRDIKPLNILVKYRDPSGDPEYLKIKLSDFGLSKTGSLKTYCGTPSYLPPEVRDDGTRQKYTKAVDIWSLGAVMLRFAYTLPPPGSGSGIAWCEKLVEEVNSWESDSLIDILQCMLVMDAERRYSAAVCLREASRLLVLPSDHSSTPTPGCYAAGLGQRETGILTDEQFISHHAGQSSGYSLATDAQWAFPPPGAHHQGLLGDQSFARSAAPTPSTVKPTSRSARKRTKETSKPSLSSGGRHSKRPSTINFQDSELFGPGWLQDSRCVGSFVADMGREEASDPGRTGPLRGVGLDDGSEPSLQDAHFFDDAASRSGGQAVVPAGRHIQTTPPVPAGHEQEPYHWASNLGLMGSPKQPGSFWGTMAYTGPFDTPAERLNHAIYEGGNDVPGYTHEPDPGAALSPDDRSVVVMPAALIPRLVLALGQPTGYMCLERQNGEIAAVCEPNTLQVNLTSLLKGAGVDKSRRDAILRRLRNTEKTVVKSGAAVLKGTWTSFACALEVADAWQLPDLKDVITLASEHLEHCEHPEEA